jgi:hypothetical protein
MRTHGNQHLQKGIDRGETRSIHIV